ncbi:hypothetical protein FRACYDRAFT_191607 [Fragilariopsis cylindrus CCMP1102]|uniref:Small nuclear ribonucleoprotein Prp3 C-terminal domain-containing protein n=1 Tax=Fragilariopsis cylindrus CCMP1102 TaxID=635003 RepID=A0A1E7F204_9STRA|nr:hypothetical protein FRACYDRAFT_191607 [Fragilariopsis cylindrus CCMP1102]|eukprot:OEU12146.1 hypothetical protein FRACYDRAFT_191607 [Fragilariopsis cylindrus CCMP1102]
MISRKLIYSHHIIAKSKRKAISDLGNDYNIGGYYKIGWPGIIIIEGEENSCNDFIDEIRSMRWQHLVVRGETEKQHLTFEINSDSSFFSTKKVTMIELGEDQMSTLSKICNDVGLKDLFMTSMKIYNNNININDDDGDNDDDDDKEDSNNNNNNVAVDRKKHHVEENTTNE